MVSTVLVHDMYFCCCLALQIEVDKLDEQTYLLRVFCQKDSGILMQLMHSLESLNANFLSANYTTLHESIMNTFVIEVRPLANMLIICEVYYI